MTEQCKHKFEITKGRGVICQNCPESITYKEAEARLNEYETLKAATERLSAVAANGLLDLMATGIPSYLSSVWTSWLDALQAYADILDGKDE